MPSKKPPQYTKHKDPKPKRPPAISRIDPSKIIPTRKGTINPKTGLKRGNIAMRPRPGIKLDKEVIITLLRENQGNMSRVADIIGCNRQTIQAWKDRDEDVREACIQARERQLDTLEESVWDRAMRERDTGLQAFLLKTVGRKRGYEQNQVPDTTKDIATAAFDFIVNQAKPKKD